MFGRRSPVTFDLNEHRSDSSLMTRESDGRVEPWTIDVPSAMWMLDGPATKPCCSGERSNGLMASARIVTRNICSHNWGYPIHAYRRSQFS